MSLMKGRRFRLPFILYKTNAVMHANIYSRANSGISPDGGKGIRMTGESMDRTPGMRKSCMSGECGQTLIEYVLILVLIALVVVLVLRGFSG